MPVSSRKARAKLRSLMQARRASAGTDRSSPRWSGSHSCSSRSGRRSAICAASWALNCAWPPGRLRNSTSQRDLAAEVLLDERQREVHAGGDARRGGHVAVADEDLVGLDLDLRMAPPKLRAVGPVRGGAT